jgi:hypothetical protein
MLAVMCMHVALTLLMYVYKHRCVCCVHTCLDTCCLLVLIWPPALLQVLDRLMPCERMYNAFAQPGHDGTRWTRTFTAAYLC